jgi:putative glycosyltransferase (TIGR04348 family)
VLLICPASPGSRAGNRATALRWAAKLRALGHRVRIRAAYGNEPCDVLVALHARKSAPAVFASLENCPERPIIVALTGTDLYRDLPDSAEAQRAMELAARLVVLQPLAIERIAEPQRVKARLIYQSAVSTPDPDPPDPDYFDICVSGHLRDEKDPFRAALAARLLPPASRIRILHAGRAMTADFAEQARQEELRNPRYRWLGELARKEARRLLASCRALALTSKIEGGANVISEAIVDGVPVIASRIDGSVGLLGPDHPAFFPAGDTEALAGLILRLEQDPAFYEEEKMRCLELQPLFRPERELDSWRHLIEDVSGARHGRTV